MPQPLEPTDALLVVDMQRDFCPGGALPVEGGHDVVPVINEWIEQARQDGAMIVASRDWHPPGHCSFKEQGGAWPEHCVQGTPGAEFHSDLRLPRDAVEIKKGQDLHADAYSAFDRTDLEERLRKAGIQRVFIGGLAQDVCVHATALDAEKAGFETRVIADATRPAEVAPGDGERAMRELRERGVSVVSSEGA